MSNDRYHRQALVPSIGEAGQQRLAEASVLVIGCGALGTVSADLLARAGIGHIRIADRDIVEVTNLQRQVLFDESDLASPKATAARDRLHSINSTIDIEAFVEDVDASNIERLADGCTAFVDGLDNFETRYLLNDLAVSTNRPWFYGGAVGTTGMSAAIIPGESPCLRCVFPEPPAPGLNPTCDTAGVLGPVVHMVAAHQAMQAIKFLSGHAEAVDRRVHSFDAWANTRHAMDITVPREDCPCCGLRRFQWLQGQRTSSTTVLCGRDAVQVKPDPGSDSMRLDALAERLADHGTFRGTSDVLHGRLEEAGVDLTVFPDGRALIKGSTTPEQARTIYARYIGT